MIGGAGLEGDDSGAAADQSSSAASRPGSSAIEGGGIDGNETAGGSPPVAET